MTYLLCHDCIYPWWNTAGRAALRPKVIPAMARGRSSKPFCHIESLRQSQRLITELRNHRAGKRHSLPLEWHLKLPEHFPRSFHVDWSTKEATFDDLVVQPLLSNMHLACLLPSVLEAPEINEVWLSSICDIEKLHACLFSLPLHASNFEDTNITKRLIHFHLQAMERTNWRGRRDSSWQ